MSRTITMLAALALLLGGGSARADTITQNIAGPFAPIGGLPSFGQSLMTPSGGPWHDLTFNFFSDVPATTPTAAGTAFLLTQEYLGTPANLSSAPGLQAQTSNIVAGQWIFAPGVTVQPNTMYWVYQNSIVPQLSLGNVVPSIHSYFANTANSDFSSQSASTNFRLSGDVVPAVVPEPARLTLLGISAVGMMGYAWRRRRKAASGNSNRKAAGATA
jgi:hypothetical protein